MAPPEIARFLDASAHRDRARRHRRQLAIGASFVTLAAVAVVATLAAAEFADQERQARAQAMEINLAAADVGRFELLGRPFDWDARLHRATPVDAARYSNRAPARSSREREAFGPAHSAASSASLLPGSRADNSHACPSGVASSRRSESLGCRLTKARSR